MAIRFGRRGDKYACFSNFYEAPIKCEGVVFGTSEALWQALKTLDKEERLKFTYLNPSEAKRLGRRVKLREDWEDVKYSYMVAVLELKFKQHLDLQEILLSTGDEELIENTTGWHDNIWGDCNCAKCKGIVGQNLLGKALMEVRAYIRNGDEYENPLKAIFEDDEDKKFDDYKRLGVYDIDLSSMRFQKAYYENDLVALRVVGVNGGIDIPIALLDSDFEFKVKDSISLQFYDDMYISEIEYKNKVVYPSLNELNDDIMFKVKEQLS